MKILNLIFILCFFINFQSFAIKVINEKDEEILSEFTLGQDSEIIPINAKSEYVWNTLLDEIKLRAQRRGVGGEELQTIAAVNLKNYYPEEQDKLVIILTKYSNVPIVGRVSKHNLEAPLIHSFHIDEKKESEEKKERNEI